MMTLLDIADMLADVLDFEAIYAGNIDANKDSCIGVYASKNAYPQKMCVGGKACTKTKDKTVTILVHWTDNPTTAEIKSNEILDKLTDVRGYNANDYTVGFFKSKIPQSVGRDDRGICEYVIETTIYYERNE